MQDSKKESPQVDINETSSVTSSSSSYQDELAKLPADHPVHKIPMEKQEKMRKDGVNPILKAEMDQCFETKSGTFSTLFGMTSMSGWFFR